MHARSTSAVRVAVLLCCCLGAAALAEGAEHGRQKPDAPTRLRGLTTLIEAPDGSLLSVGGSTLRRLPPGGVKAERVHRIPGDNLYRVAGDRSGRILATWEKDGAVHYFDRRRRKHLVIPPPPGPDTGVSRSSVEHLAFLPDGGALVHLHGSTERPHARDVHLGYRVDLETRAWRLLYRLDDVRLLARLGDVALYLAPERPGQRCDRQSCSVGEITAHRVTAHGVERTVLVRGDGNIDNARMIWGESRDLAVILLERRKFERQLLRWRVGEPTAQVRPFPRAVSGERLAALRTGDVLRMVLRRDEDLHLHRHAPDGSIQTAHLLSANDADTVDTDLYDVGTRANGSLWLHWGDFILLFDRDLPRLPRAFAVDHLLLTRRDEWGGIGVYVREPEALWIAIDRRSGRDFARLSFAELERRAKPWNPPRMAADVD